MALVEITKGVNSGEKASRFNSLGRKVQKMSQHTKRATVVVDINPEDQKFWDSLNSHYQRVFVLDGKQESFEERFSHGIECLLKKHFEGSAVMTVGIYSDMETQQPDKIAKTISTLVN